MDFFKYAQFVQGCTNNETEWVSYLIGALCYAIVFIFSAVALFTIAVREGYKHKWMAFVPFFNTYYIGVCGQKNRCFNLDAKKVAMAAAILDFILVVGYSVYYIGNAMLASGGYLKASYNTMYGFSFVEYEVLDVPQSLEWAKWCFYNLYDVFLWWLQLVYLFLYIMVLSCFFQTFAARRYFIFTFTCIILPIQGILFFILRNNRGMNYRDYLRREQEKQYRMYQQYNRQNDPYNNPYNNPYNRNPYSRGYGEPPYNANGGTDDPFADSGRGAGGSEGKGSDGSDDPFASD